MKIGIYGGSFNPIHRGHTSLARSLVRQGLLDEIWLMVSPLNPLKADNTLDGLQPTYDQRYRMAQLATSRIQGVIASDFERNLPLPSYTINTLHQLTIRYPEHEFHLIIGADNWQRFPNWYHADEILRTYPIIVFNRPGSTPQQFGLPAEARITFAHTQLYDISSTQIRKLIQLGHNTRGLINHRVQLYINQHLLYNS